MPGDQTRKRLLNEEEVIDLIWRVVSGTEKRKQSKKQKTRIASSDPFNDDVAWIEAGRSRSRFLICKADMLVSDTDAPPQMTPDQLAAKAITSAVSDFASKGMRPSYCILSIAIPRDKSTEEYVRSMTQGFKTAFRRYNLKLVAGDTNSSEHGVVINVSLFGLANSFVKRSGAKPGQLVGVSGPFGLQSSGLAIMLGQMRSEDQSFQKRAMQSILEPRARLELGVKIRKYLSSSTDSSDGLALSLYHLAESSNVDLHLTSVPMAEGVQQFASFNGKRGEDLALFGGEEYELVFTFDQRYDRMLKRLGMIVIGNVVRAEDKKSPSVFLGSRVVERKGWIHNQ